MDLKQPDGPNPYAPPTSDLNVDAPPPVEGQLAERGTRFFAQLVDGLLFMLVLVPAFIVGFQNGMFRQGDSTALFRTFGTSGLGMLSGAAWIGLILFQAYLVATSGQSIAKKLFAIKIVKVDGSRVNFVSGVLLRHWLLMLVQQIPVVNMILPLLDALFIFRRDRRCIHDLIAGTKVIRLGGATAVGAV